MKNRPLFFGVFFLFISNSYADLSTQKNLQIVSPQFQKGFLGTLQDLDQAENDEQRKGVLISLGRQFKEEDGVDFGHEVNRGTLWSLVVAYELGKPKTLEALSSCVKPPSSPWFAEALMHEGRYTQKQFEGALTLHTDDENGTTTEKKLYLLESAFALPRERYNQMMKVLLKDEQVKDALKIAGTHIKESGQPMHTVLHEAAEHNDAEIFALIAQEGNFVANQLLSYKRQDGQTPTAIALRSGSYAVAGWLLKNKQVQSEVVLQAFDVSKNRTVPACTYLHDAAKSGDGELIDAIIKAGNYKRYNLLDHPDAKGDTPITLLFKAGRYEKAEELMKQAGFGNLQKSAIFLKKQIDAKDTSDVARLKARTLYAKYCTLKNMVVTSVVAPVWAAVATLVEKGQKGVNEVWGSTGTRD